MAVKSFGIENFAQYKNFDISFGRGVNVLIGKNGVGKTILLKWLYMPMKQNWKLFGIDQKYVEKSNLFDYFAGIKFYEELHSIVDSKRVFIPAKEMLTHAKGLLAMKNKYGDNMPFDDTLLDIIEKAQAWKLKETPEIAKNIVKDLENTIDGTVQTRDDGSFWMKKSDGSIIPFSMEADGFKRLGLLWQLLMNETITENTIVLWDEPEASINPENIPVLVNAMLELSRRGVQIIAATHSYNFTRYFDILRNDGDNVNYYCLYKSDSGYTEYSQAGKFTELSPNPIDDAGEQLYEKAIQKSMGEI